jgi:hypothetical protein
MHESLPIRATPYAHQRDAYEFALRKFGVGEGGDAEPVSGGCFYLMDMG